MVFIVKILTLYHSFKTNILFFNKYFFYNLHCRNNYILTFFKQNILVVFSFIIYFKDYKYLYL